MLIYIEAVIVLMLGMVLGSFSTALIHRIPKKMSWGAVRSQCPSCKTSLNAFDLVPVFSWLFARGKCRHCSVKISAQYPLIELISAFACLCAYFVYGLSTEAFFVFAAVPVLVSLFVIDCKYMILPNILVFILLCLGIVRLFYFSLNDVFHQAQDLFPYIGGAFIYAGLSWLLGAVLTKVLKKESLGFGDVKFFAASGIWLGLSALPNFMIFSGLSAIIIAIIWRIVFKKQKFPFGPALILTFYGILLFQGSFLS